MEETKRPAVDGFHERRDREPLLLGEVFAALPLSAYLVFLYARLDCSYPFRTLSIPKTSF